MSKLRSKLVTFTAGNIYPYESLFGTAQARRIAFGAELEAYGHDSTKQRSMMSLRDNRQHVALSLSAVNGKVGTLGCGSSLPYSHRIRINSISHSGPEN